MNSQNYSFNNLEILTSLKYYFIRYLSVAQLKLRIEIFDFNILFYGTLYYTYS
jgi:hypothetical protein